MSDGLDFVKAIKHPAARLAGLAAIWLRSAPSKGRESSQMMTELVAEALEKAWLDPKTRRMTLVLLRSTHGWKHREVAQILGVSPIELNLIQLGRRPLSREGLEKVAAAKELPLERLNEVLLLTHAMNIEIDAAWEMTWQETLAPLSPRERRAKVLEDRDLRNWGLSDLICSKSLEAADLDEAVTLAELALLIAENLPSRPKRIQKRYLGYVWGHLGHALQRRGNQAAAETAFAECIELWAAGEGFGSDDRIHAERLAAIVPAFPPYEPPRRRSPKKKRAKRVPK